MFDFQLIPDELAAIDALHTGVRGGPEPEVITREIFAIANSNLDVVAGDISRLTDVAMGPLCPGLPVESRTMISGSPWPRFPR